MNSKISRDLAYFLKEKKVYTKFLKYTRTINVTSLNIRSFNWTDTVEGYSFWNEIDKAYYNRLCEKLQEYWQKNYGSNNLLKTSWK